MEARTSISPQPAAGGRGPLAAVRRDVGRWGLIAALAMLPVYYGINDLISGYRSVRTAIRSSTTTSPSWA